MPRFRFVFTPVGAAVLVISILMLVRALLNRNSYEIVIFSFALLLLLVLGVIGEWKSRKLKIMEPGWKPPFPMTASSKLASAFAAGVDDAAEISKMTQVSGLESKIPLFFRQHFYVRGRLFPGGAGFSSELKGGCSVLVETSIPRGNTSAQLPLDFPMSGIFFGDGYCKLRDIFGFFSFPCGIPQRRTVKIRCSPCFGKNIKINAKSGAEDRRYKPSADEERYYMREYSPGDRLRDINWKSSEKIDTLITRISNDNQEKVSRIEVHFRNYGADNISLAAQWLLDRAKARLSYFLRSIKDQNVLFVFDVFTAAGSFEIQDEEDLDAFLEELSGFSFFPPKNEVVGAAGSKTGASAAAAGDMYVFSTACDSGLQGFLLTNSQRSVTLFLSQPGTDIQRKDDEILHISDFNNKGCVLPPKFLRSKVKPLNINTHKIEINRAGITV